MKSSDDKPLSHRIHALMYKKQDEINRLQARPVVLFHLVDAKRKELAALEAKFARQVAFERSKK